MGFHEKWKGKGERERLNLAWHCTWMDILSCCYSFIIHIIVIVKVGFSSLLDLLNNVHTCERGTDGQTDRRKKLLFLIGSNSLHKVLLTDRSFCILNWIELGVKLCFTLRR
jgi:hypothetical protein